MRDAIQRTSARHMDSPDDSSRETYNPWSIVNLVFRHLADEGLHPVLGGAGGPGGPAAEGDRQIGQRGRRGLAALRAAAFGDDHPAGTWTQR